MSRIIATFLLLSFALQSHAFTRFDEKKIRSTVNEIESTLSDTIGESSEIDSLGETHSWGIETDSKGEVETFIFFINYTVDAKHRLMKCYFHKQTTGEFTTNACRDTSTGKEI